MCYGCCWHDANSKMGRVSHVSFYALLFQMSFCTRAPSCFVWSFRPDFILQMCDLFLCGVTHIGSSNPPPLGRRSWPWFSFAACRDGHVSAWCIPWMKYVSFEFSSASHWARPSQKALISWNGLRLSATVGVMGFVVQKDICSWSLTRFV